MRQPQDTSRHVRAFTLVELLCVVAIIGILAAILFATLSGLKKAQRRTQCAANLRTVGIAIMSYAIDRKGTLPGPLWHQQNAMYRSNSAGNGFDVASHPYLGTRLGTYLGLQVPKPGGTSLVADVLLCPAWASEPRGTSALWFASSYFGYPGDGTIDRDEPSKLMEIDRPATTVALVELDGKNGGSKSVPVVHDSIRNTLYFDGHVSAVPVK